MSKHSFEPAENHMAHTDTDWCKVKYCPRCGCVKEIYRKGTIYKMGGKFFENEPECIKNND